MSGDAERLHHLDALRALAMFLILPAHAIGLLGLQQAQTDLGASLAWLIHSFRLPLFFLVAGFFAALLLRARGLGSLLHNRLIRIGIPLTIVVLTAGPLLVILLNQVAGGQYRPGSTGLEAFTQLRPSYVWFLWYLLLLYAVALALRSLLVRWARLGEILGRGGRLLVAHWSAPLVLAVPCAAALFLQASWIAAAPADSFVPEPELLAYYSLFFACGWLMFAAPGLRDTVEQRPRHYLTIAAISVPPALVLYLKQGDTPVAGSDLLHFLALLLLSVSTWSLVFGLLGLGRRLLSGANPRTRYWADSSYWIYLSHFPVMAAIAIAIADVGMPGALRAGLLIGVTLALIYPAYGALVRHTAIGRVLHGPRSGAPERRRPPQLTQPTAAAERRA